VKWVTGGAFAKGVGNGMEVEERETWIRVDHLLNGEIKFGNDERL
jgi:hypothetical protein